jgi:hypothetical protein
LVVSLLTALVLRPHLAELLEELCGSRARASFWLVLSGLCLFLIGILAGTVSYGYGAGANLSAQELFFGLITQVRAGLVGLLVSLLCLAWVLLGFVRRFEEGLVPTFHVDPEPAGWRGGAAGTEGAPSTASPPSPTSAAPTTRATWASEADPTRWRREVTPGETSAG